MNYLFAFNFVSGHRINGHIQIRTFDEIKTTLEHGIVVDLKRGNWGFEYPDSRDSPYTGKWSGGSFSSFEVSVKTTIPPNFHKLTPEYKFTGVEVVLTHIVRYIEKGDYTGALDLFLKGLGRGDKDKIIGSSGDDVLRGGTFRNEFIYHHKIFGNDAIDNFQKSFTNEDKIVFSRSIFDKFADVKQHSKLDGHGNVVIEYDANDTITLRGVHHLHADDFLFVT